MSVTTPGDARRCHNPRSEVRVPDERFREVRDLFEAALEQRPENPLAWLSEVYGDRLG